VSNRLKPRGKVRANHRSVTGKFSPGPGKPLIEFESGLEHFFLIYVHLRYPSVEVKAQPFPLQYSNDSGQLTRYTPDFLVSVPDRAKTVVEIKRRRDLSAIWTTYRPRLLQMHAHCREKGWSLRVVTDRFLSEVFVWNIRRLSSALDGPPISEGRLEAAMEAARSVFQQSEFPTLRTLERSLPIAPSNDHPDTRAMLYLIARRRIRIDLRSARFTADTRIQSVQ
jgi:hypothetical protein